MTLRPEIQTVVSALGTIARPGAPPNAVIDARQLLMSGAIRAARPYVDRDTLRALYRVASAPISDTSALRALCGVAASLAKALRAEGGVEVGEPAKVERAERGAAAARPSFAVELRAELDALRAELDALRADMALLTQPTPPPSPIIDIAPEPAPAPVKRRPRRPPTEAPNE
jgi:hypothetical protein